LIPNVERIAVLTRTETHFKKIVAANQDNHGLIFIEASKPLRPMSTFGLGDPILIKDPRAASIKLSLEVAGQEHPSAWTPTLQDLLDLKPIPHDVAEEWRAQIRHARRDMTWFRRLFDGEFQRGLKIDALLSIPGVPQIPPGVLAQGQSAKRLLGNQAHRSRRALAEMDARGLLSSRAQHPAERYPGRARRLHRPLVRRPGTHLAALAWPAYPHPTLAGSLML